jgi:hypothetical protein
MNDPVATLKVVALREGREELEIVATLGRPRAGEDGAWVCPVEIAPLSQGVEVRGVDAFHALWLGCSLVLKVLASFRAEGWALAGEDGRPFPLDAYLAGLDAKPPV